ncbi:MULTISPECIES: septal ring lytic transglycosylase RlpA family protein [unclassified Synechocystis]|uniref:septal ring lytic transglycosylase RlpA family protein n=1 Tax=unclassified Synechocystis TaxID=2640012 RepID=UPI0004917E6B|nr:MULTISPECIES: septal ring lytic transglycosylase RlpA family protein [unclassified Synechocystis]MCT0255168.1 septal ring lytic transglycosylase RlpA family protein [Synechocystis sp. CS-94]
MKGINVCRSIAGVIGTASLTTLVWGNCPSGLMALNVDAPADAPTTVSENNSSLAPLESSLTAASSTAASTFQDTELISLVPHQGPGSRLAVTLRINQIPVVTFLGTKAELIALSNDQDTDTMERAQTVARRIDELSGAESFDAGKIKVGLDAGTKQLVVKAEDKILLTINKNTVLPEKSLSAPETALQTANRLRRLLGGVDPIVSLPAAMQVARVNTFDAAATIQRIRGGIASWYGPGFHGRRTANGERFNQNALTAAHRTLPFGTRVKVTNLRNGQSVIVRINDRGPFTGGRVIDLSAGAARAIGIHSSGVGNVALDIVQ